MEKWKFINNSSIYQVSDAGNIRCVDSYLMRKDGKSYHIKQQLLRPFRSKSGYLIFRFRGDLQRHILIHRAVLEAFMPVDGMENLQVNHKDGNKENNCLDNLEWTTRCENMRHAMSAGLFNPQNRFGEKHPMCKLNEAQVNEIRERIKSGKRGIQHKLAVEYDVSETTICNIKCRKTRKLG